MSAEQLFSICNSLAMLGWIVLIVFPRAQWPARIVTIPLLLALVYIVLVPAHWGEPPGGGFSTLHAVSTLFSNQWLLLAGWIHFLAFDLFIGAWEVRDAQRRRVPHLLVIPCLILTFLFGPIGLLCYFVVRTVRGARIFDLA